jgi:predicted acetyltransferase
VPTELRRVDLADAEAFCRHIWQVFGGAPNAEQLERLAARFEPDFALGVYERGRIVASASAYPLELTLPAGADHPCPLLAVPGVTQVGVAPTHRRQGLLTRLMEHQLADLRGRGYPIAILLASESVIYGRFGYGLAQSSQSLAIESDRDAYCGGARVARGRLRMVDPEEAGKVLPDVHDRARGSQPGELGRTARWWRQHLADYEDGREGKEARLYAVHESPAGEADGFVGYRFDKCDWPSGIPRHKLHVDDLVAWEPAVAAALWRFLLDVDLVDEVVAVQRPLDEPLRWLLADPRRLRTTDIVDHLWVRILDVPAALCARGYGAEERLVLDLGAEGRFVLESGPGAGSCRRATKREKAHLALGIAELGAIYLGGVAPSVLAAAGRVTELQPGALRAADRVFSSPVAPFCTLDF